MGKAVASLIKLIQEHEKSLSNKQVNNSVYDNISNFTNHYVTLQAKYAKTFQGYVDRAKSEENAVDIIIEDLKIYCIQRFRERKDKLPVVIDFKRLNQENKRKYAQDIYHTAYRYFLNPNPFHDPHSYQGIAKKIGEAHVAANIPYEKKKMIAFYWLLMIDPNVRLEKNVSIDDAKTLFLREIALINRTHNWRQVNFFADTKENFGLDDPSCPKGIKDRLEQCLAVFPEFDQSQSIGVKLCQLIKDSYKGCKFALKKAYFIENKLKITQAELHALMSDLVLSAFWQGDNHRKTIDQIVNDWVNVCIDQGVADGPNLLQIADNKIDYFKNLILQIFDDMVSELRDADAQLKSEELHYEKKVYESSFSNPDLIEALENDPILKNEKYYNYAVFYQDQILGNYENMWEIFIEHIQKVFEIKDFFDIKAYKEDLKEQRIKFKFKKEREQSALKAKLVFQKILQKAYKKQQQGTWFYDKKSINDVFSKENNNSSVNEDLFYTLIQQELQNLASPYQLIHGYPIEGMLQMNIPQDGHCLFNSVLTTCKNHANIQLHNINDVQQLRTLCSQRMQAKYDAAINNLRTFITCIQNMIPLNENFMAYNPWFATYRHFAGFINTNFNNLDLNNIDDNKIDIFSRFLQLPEFFTMVNILLVQTNYQQLLEDLNVHNLDIQALVTKLRNSVIEIQSLNQARIEHNMGDPLRAVNSIPEYINLMTGNIWGGDYELGILAEILNINIRCIKQTGGRIVLDNIVGNPNLVDRTVVVLHCNGDHYQGLTNQLNLRNLYPEFLERTEYLGIQLKDAINYLYLAGNVEGFLEKLEYSHQLLTTEYNNLYNVQRINKNLNNDFDQIEKAPDGLEEINTLINYNRLLKDMFTQELVVNHFNKKRELFAQTKKIKIDMQNELNNKQPKIDEESIKKILGETRDNMQNDLRGVISANVLMAKLKKDYKTKDKYNIIEDVVQLLDNGFFPKEYDISVKEFIEIEKNENMKKQVNVMEKKFDRFGQMFAQNVDYVKLNKSQLKQKKKQNPLKYEKKVKHPGPDKAVKQKCNLLQRRLKNIKVKIQSIVYGRERSKNLLSYYELNKDKYNNNLLRLLQERDAIVKDINSQVNNVVNREAYINVKREYDNLIRDVNKYKKEFK